MEELTKSTAEGEGTLWKITIQLPMQKVLSKQSKSKFFKGLVFVTGTPCIDPGPPPL